MKVRIGVLGFALLSLVACSDSSGSKPASRENAAMLEVTRENYLSGRDFCDKYREITSKEFGRYVQVPKDYSDPSKGTLEIYVYSANAFNRLKKTLINIDGGPGQNSHGYPEVLANYGYNELYFDQRGLGCSAPETYDLYMDNSLYSSLNTARDLEEIRKAFGITQWTVYGISYGTIPATIYGSLYPKSTRSVVLEGVVGRYNQVHLPGYKAEKLNLVLETFNKAQRDSFSNLITDESSPLAAFLISMIDSAFYSDRGFRKLKADFHEYFPASGGVRNDLIEAKIKALSERESKYTSPQQPKAIDRRILNVLYCKNMQRRDKSAQYMNYSRSQGFYVYESSSNTQGKVCDDYKVSRSDEQPYRLEDYAITSPVYYFQGSHDGATMAIGALDHWKTIARGTSYFMLAQKGGHNPNLSRIFSGNTALSNTQKELFELSVLGQNISSAAIEKVNQHDPEGLKWLLYQDPKNAPNLTSELDGFQRPFKMNNAGSKYLFML